MCVIMIKKQGVNLPDYETIKTMMDNNSDGAGFMYAYKGKLTIHKGYTKPKSLYKALKNIPHLKNTPVVVHCRIATDGGINPSNCHPFPVTAEPVTDTFTSKYSMAMAHNGVIQGYKTGYNANITDSQNFINTLVCPLLSLGTLKNKAIKGIIETTIGASKLAFLDKNGQLYTFGQWINDGGILYSNDSYKPYLPIFKYDTGWFLYDKGYADAEEGLAPVYNIDEYMDGYNDFLIDNGYYTELKEVIQ